VHGVVTTTSKHASVATTFPATFTQIVSVG